MVVTKIFIALREIRAYKSSTWFIKTVREWLKFQMNTTGMGGYV